MIFLLLALGVNFIGYGALVASGKHTPLSSRLMVEEENLKPWCKTAGISKMVWGVVLIFAAFYLMEMFPRILWGACFVVCAVWNINYTMKNNRKYMK